MVPSFFKVSVQRFLVLLGAYFLVRLLFLLWNWSIFALNSWPEIVHAFINGLRFDTSTILLTNSLLFVLWMLPTRWLRKRWFRVANVVLFTVINLICLGVSVIDAEFVKFIGKRTSYDLLFIRGDVERHSLSILSTYWYFCLGLIGLVAVVLWLAPRTPRETPAETWLAGTLWRLSAAVLIFIGMRGGVAYKPINPMQAYFSTKHELGLLSLNTPFNLIKSQPNGWIERTRYFKTDSEAILHLKKITELTRPPLAVAKNWNVVILILESFSQEYTGIGNPYPGYTPFVNSLAEKSFTYKYNFANARRSIEGLPAVLCGIPAIMEEPIITSDFSHNRMDCLPKILTQRGYSTYFLHGAHNGSMHFDSFSRLAGFENFVGLNEYPKGNPDDFDKYWGVLDEPMLQYATTLIDNAAKPVMLGLFSLSSHHPYYIPPKYKGKFPEGNLEIHETIGYTDYALERFFATAKTKPWFNNTIFVLTADHTQKTEVKEYKSLAGYYRVPLLIYIPGLERMANKVAKLPDRITQHIDIMPSVLDLLGVTLPNRLLVGQSVFDQGSEGRAYNYTSYSYWYMDSKVFLDFGRPPHPLRGYLQTNTFQLDEKPPTSPEFVAPLENLKAVVHYMNEGLTHNSLYNWKEGI